MADLAATSLTDYLALAGPDISRSKHGLPISLPQAQRLSFRLRPSLLIGKNKSSQTVKNYEGTGFFLIAILQYITSIKKTENRLALTLSEFNAVLESIDYGVLFMDSDLKSISPTVPFGKCGRFRTRYLTEN